MIELIICCIIVGLSLLYFLKIDKLSNYVLFSLPIGIVINTIIFTLLALFKVLYSKELFYFVTALFTILFFYQNVKRKMKIKNDLKGMPIWFIILLFYILIKLIIMASTSYFDFYNFDEFTAYTKISKILFISQDLSKISYLFTPMMYFIGSMTFNILGNSNMIIVRTISPIFFILIVLFIYQVLKEKNVNRHIASLIACLFIVSSSENIVLTNTFYTNIIFSFYIVTGSYLLLKNTIGKEDKKNIILANILLIGCCLVRREGIYLYIGITLYIMLMQVLKNKKVLKKYLILFVSSLIFCFGFTVINKAMIPNIPNMEKINTNISENENRIIDKISKKITLENGSIYLKNLYNQTFEKDYYYYNYFAFTCLLLSIVIYIIELLKKKNKNNRFFNYINGVFFIETLYLVILLYTQIVLFSENEFRLAASFSRYFLSFIPLNFIVCGICLFENTNIIKEKMRKIASKIKNPKVLIIIPAYNEEKNILKTYNDIINYNEKHKTTYDVIVINDGSLDNTKKVLLDNDIPHISLITNLGIGGAVQTGYKYALKNNYDIAIQFDGDGQHDVNYIKTIINPIINGEAHMVIGSRFVKKDENNFNSTFARRIGINIISLIINKLSNIKIYDTTSGFRACNKDIIKKWADQYPNEYPEPVTDFELLKEGYIIIEKPVVMKERKEGKSSIHTWKNIYYMINVILTIFIINIRRK